MLPLPWEAEQPGVQEMPQIRVLLPIAVTGILLLFGCGSGSGTSVFAPESGHPKNWVNPQYIGTQEFHGFHVSVKPGFPEGAALFARKCSDCHGRDGSGNLGPDIRGRSASFIQNAIATRIYMKWLKSLSFEEIQAIAGFLSDPANAGIEPTPDTFNADACIDCHGVSLDGGISRISCYACHRGPTGRAGHEEPVWREGKENPIHYHGFYSKGFAISCTACHGPDLNGPLVPSCYKCHNGSEWNAF